MIVYYDENSSTRNRHLRRGSTSLNTHLKLATTPMPRYLKASTDVKGRNNGPITVDMKVDETCARLVLQSRVASKKQVMDTTSWVTGREVYFIRCARRRFKKEGFLCMKFKPSQDKVPVYRLKIVPSTEQHNDENRFMIFRLLPTSLRAQIAIEPEDIGKLLKAKRTSSSGDNGELEKLNAQYRRFSEWHVASRHVK